MRKVIFTLIILAIIIVGVIAETKIEENYIKTATTESVLVTESTSLPPTTEKPSETNTEPILTISETETTEKIPEESKNGQYLGRWYITGYTAEEGFYYGKTTASGVGCKPGICAMNNGQRETLGINWGDSVYVEGHGVYRVQDCTAEYIYNTIDIWCYTNEEAFALTGYYEVWILE